MRYFVEERLQALDKATQERALREFPPKKPITPADKAKAPDPSKSVPPAVRELDNSR